VNAPEHSEEVEALHSPAALSLGPRNSTSVYQNLGTDANLLKGGRAGQRFECVSLTSPLSISFVRDPASGVFLLDNRRSDVHCHLGSAGHQLSRVGSGWPFV